MRREHHEKHPDDMVVSNQQGAVFHHPSCPENHAEHCIAFLQWPLVSDSSTWGEVKFIMAALNLNRRCNPFIWWNYLFYYAYSSNFHAYRNLSKQSLKKRIGLLQDRNDITIQKLLQKLSYVGFYLDYLAFPNSQVVPLSISHTARVTKTTVSTSGTGRLRGSFSNILPKWVVRSLSSKAWICYLKIFYL